MVLGLLYYDLIKLLLPVEKAAFPAVVPRPVPGIDINKDFSYFQCHCLLWGAFSRSPQSSEASFGLPVTAEVMPQWSHVLP